MRNPFEDSSLSEYHSFLRFRTKNFQQEYERICRGWGTLAAYSSLHKKLGVHAEVDALGREVWRVTEHMPAASNVWLATSRTGFELRPDHEFVRMADGFWQLYLPREALSHGDYFEIRLQGEGPQIQRRVPAFAKWVEQDPKDPNQWCARLWDPAEPYQFQHAAPGALHFPRIYEAHIGMAADARHRKEGAVGSYNEFTEKTLKRIAESGYTAVQLMGVLEHPLYKSFGYQVSSYFAPSSRNGTPDDFKRLVDEAHRLGIAVILDVTHGHACTNAEQGIANYDTSRYIFDKKSNQWGTPSFDYAKEMTRRFLLSNCLYWMEDYRVDGFRFDAVGNMLYLDHGIGDDFCHVGRCFYGKDGKPRTNVNGELYLCLANTLIHEMRPEAISIAEEFSGMPGLTCSPLEGGLGFDYRFAMGIPDFWAKFIKTPDSMEKLWYEMTNHRVYDRTISYVECHDQCINGDDAMIWRLIGDAMYTRMSPFNATWNETRGVALYRLMRAVTLNSAHAGWLNFMGAEFGHPEWLDDAEHGHRQWHLTEDEASFYASLSRWDRAQLFDLVARHEEWYGWEPFYRMVHEDHRLLAFMRGDLVFAFNFHETRAEPEFRISVRPGKYVELMSSDEPRFGGHGNLDPQKNPAEHFSDAATGIDMQDITVYVPPLTVLVLKRAPDPEPAVIVGEKKPRSRKACAKAKDAAPAEATATAANAEAPKPKRRACGRKALKAEDIPADRCGEVIPGKKK
ncbi:MAG: alpha amylase C-terminal domain-containing protein [Mailhella sp.]|nr:alpha amylase C-terminal domain-containing protein [Mailhella sp.]